jgi:hypothetical protein
MMAHTWAENQADADSVDASTGDYPPSRLARDSQDVVEVAVIVDQRDAMMFGNGRDQQISDADRPALAAGSERALHVEGTLPLLVVCRQVLIGATAVCPNCLVVGASAGTVERL